MLKKEIDHSTLHSFDAPFRLLHADVGNLEFLGKNATFPHFGFGRRVLVKNIHVPHEI